MKNKINVWLMWVVMFTPSFSLFAMGFHEPVIESPILEPSEGGAHTDSLQEEQGRKLQQAALRRQQLVTRQVPGGLKKGQKPLKTLPSVIEVPEPGDASAMVEGAQGTTEEGGLTAADIHAAKTVGKGKSFFSTPARVENPEDVIAHHKKALAQLEAQLKTLQEKESVVGTNRAAVAARIKKLQARIEEFVKTYINDPQVLPEAPKPIEAPKKKSGLFKKKNKTQAESETLVVTPQKVKVGFFDGLAVKTVLKNESVQTDLEQMPQGEGYPSGREVVNMIVVYMRKGKTPPTPASILETVLSSVRDSSPLTLKQEEQYQKLIADVYDALLSKGKLAKVKGKGTNYGSQVDSFRSKISETVMKGLENDPDLAAVEEASTGDTQDVVNKVIQDLRNGNSPQKIVDSARIRFESEKKANAIKAEAQFPQEAYEALANKILILLIKENALTADAGEKIQGQQVELLRTLEAQKARLGAEGEKLADEEESLPLAKKELEAKKAALQKELEEVLAQQKADELTQKAIQDALAEMAQRATEEAEAKQAAALKAEAERLEQERLAALQRQQEEEAKVQALAAEVEKARQAEEAARIVAKEAESAKGMFGKLKLQLAKEEQAKLLAQKAREEAEKTVQLEAQEKAAQAAAEQAAAEAARLEAQKTEVIRLEQQQANPTTGATDVAQNFKKGTKKKKPVEISSAPLPGSVRVKPTPPEDAKETKKSMTAEELKQKALDQKAKIEKALKNSSQRLKGWVGDVSGKVKGLLTLKPAEAIEPRIVSDAAEEDNFAKGFVELVMGQEGMQMLLSDMPKTRQETIVADIVAQLRAGQSPDDVLKAELKNPKSVLRKMIIQEGPNGEKVSVFKKQPQLIKQYKELIAEVWSGMADPRVNLLPYAPDGTHPNYYQNLVQTYGMKMDLAPLETRLLLKLFERKRGDTILSEEQAEKLIKEIKPVADKVFTPEGFQQFLKTKGFLPLSTLDKFIEKLGEVVQQNNPDTEDEEQAVWRIIYQSRSIRNDQNILPQVFKAAQKVEKQYSSSGKGSLQHLTGPLKQLGIPVKELGTSALEKVEGLTHSLEGDDYTLDLEEMKRQKVLRQAQQAVDEMLNAEPNAKKAAKALTDAQAKLKEAQSAKTAQTSEGQSLIQYWEGQVARLKKENDDAQGYLQMLKEPSSSATDSGDEVPQKPVAQPVSTSAVTTPAGGKTNALSSSLKKGWSTFATGAKNLANKANKKLQEAADALGSGEALE
jgi:hypothetical protein